MSGKDVYKRQVLEGLLEVLNGSGYQLAAQAAADPEIDRLYRQPYPENQRTVGPRALKEVLERLAGPAWLLVIDPLNRLAVSYTHLDVYKRQVWDMGWCIT